MDLHLTPPSDASGGPTEPERLRAAIHHAAHLLPAQGPITVFIHHNTLHAFEHLPFDEAVQQAATVLGGEPYLSEARYREALERGRIRLADVRAELLAALGASATTPIAGLGTRLDIRLQQMQHRISPPSPAELNWWMAETDALRHFLPATPNQRQLLSETRHWLMRDGRALNGAAPAWLRDIFERFGVSWAEEWSASRWEEFTLEVLWQACCHGVQTVPEAPPQPRRYVRHRDYLWVVNHVDSDLLVHDVLIRYTAAFLDQGVAHWALPERQAGFWHAFITMYRDGQTPEPWLRTLQAELRQWSADVDPLDIACATLHALGVPIDEWDDYIQHALLALRGWAGMIQQIETRGDRVALPVPAGTLHEFVAVRLLLEKHALLHLWGADVANLRADCQRRLPVPGRRAVAERAFPLFQLAQGLGWTPRQLANLSPAAWQELVTEVDAFPDVERRRLFQRAYERRLREQCLDALLLRPDTLPPKPRWQVVTCLDEREESFRRHLEECDPTCQTFGVAGFFAVPMYYRGANDAHFIPLCPIVLTPQHWVEERPATEFQHIHARSLKARRVLGTTARYAHVGTRTFAFGAILTALLGVWASVPLVFRVLVPRWAARLRHTFGHLVAPSKPTELVLERDPTIPKSNPEALGFSVTEMGERALRLLQDIGLTSDFAPLVLLLGHGSNSLNNPHKSAYDCGACGGSPGAPNGRAAARMLNDPRVRAALQTHGIVVPETTYFIGGYHNTCNDAVTLFDVAQVPEALQPALQEVERKLADVSQRNALERARRFMSAPLTLTPREAQQHVEARSEDLAQTRPELGHATNAICIVGRRSRTRGLYFDRRAFLTSYDPTIDADGAILTRTLQAVFPVCGGINLEYYFSHVDSAIYGCGTKLPHNVSALLGVMDGAASDLRTGLPWQMVEIHEPVRLLIVCETTPDAMQRILASNPNLEGMAKNGWVQLAVLNPDRAEVHTYTNGVFERYQPTSDSLPTAPTSYLWYRGWREGLEFAAITGGTAPNA